MRWYCPGWWRDFGTDRAICPHSGLDIRVRAAVRTLARIGTSKARLFLETLRSHPAQWIRAQAAASNL